MDDIFTSETPAHEKHGYGTLEVDQITKTPITGPAEAAKIRNGVGAYAQYYGKKFKTRAKGGYLYIKRIG